MKPVLIFSILILLAIAPLHARGDSSSIMQGIQGYWDFDTHPEFKSGLFDRSGTNHHGGTYYFPDGEKQVHQLERAQGVLGKGLLFTGPSEPVMFFSDYPISHPQKMSVSLWVWMDEQTPDATMAANSSRFFPACGQFQLCVRQDGIACYFGIIQATDHRPSGKGPCEVLATGVPIPLHEWHHVVLVLSDPEAWIYLDTKQIGHIKLQQPLCDSPMTSLQFGTRRLAFRDSPKTWRDLDAWKGRMDEAAVWDRVLSVAEIRGLYAATLAGQPVTSAIAIPVWYETESFNVATAGIVLIAVTCLLHVLNTRRLRRRLAFVELQSILYRERQRISDDIHDELGSRLAKLAMHSELALAGGPRSAEHLRTVSQTAQDANRSLDELVWAVKPGHDSLADLAGYLANHASEFLEDTNLALRLDIPEILPELTVAPNVRHELLMASKEALTNIVKHANATEVGVKLNADRGLIAIKISDNGVGFIEPAKTDGKNRNGLRTIRDRMERLGGQGRVFPRDTGGTVVELNLPYSKESTISL